VVTSTRKHMRQRIQALRREKGFTLVELLVTTTIIGVLAAVVTVGVSGASSAAQTKSNIQLINGVQSGIDTFAAQNPEQTGVPVTGATPTADSTNYFGVSGTAGGVAVTTSDQVVNFTSTAGANQAFNTNFRLNNSSSTFKCVVSSTTTFTLKACRN